MAENFNEQVHSLIVCPVCYQIPRVVPVLACPGGHILCEQCGPKLVVCPLCRKTLYGENSNSVVGSIIEIAMHPCKYSIFQCSVEKPLSEIAQHEESCEQRTIICPYGGCKQEVQLRKYDLHSISNQCAIDLGEFQIFKFLWSYTVAIF